MKFRVSGSDWSEEYQVRTGPLRREWEAQLGDERWTFEVQRLEGGVFRLTIDGHTHTVTVLPGNRPGQPVRFLLDDEHHELSVQDEADLLQEVLGRQSGAGGFEELLSPMPGIIRKVLVEAGAQVEADAPLFILEAMKMENEVRAPQAAVVKALSVREGDTVAANQLLAKLSCS